MSPTKNLGMSTKSSIQEINKRSRDVLLEDPFGDEPAWSPSDEHRRGRRVEKSRGFSLENPNARSENNTFLLLLFALLNLNHHLLPTAVYFFELLAHFHNVLVSFSHLNEIFFGHIYHISKHFIFLLLRKAALTQIDQDLFGLAENFGS